MLTNQFYETRQDDQLHCDWSVTKLTRDFNYGLKPCKRRKVRSENYTGRVLKHKTLTGQRWALDTSQGKVRTDDRRTCVSRHELLSILTCSRVMHGQVPR